MEENQKCKAEEKWWKEEQHVINLQKRLKKKAAAEALKAAKKVAAKQCKVANAAKRCEELAAREAAKVLVGLCETRENPKKKRKFDEWISNTSSLEEEDDIDQNVCAKCGEKFAEPNKVIRCNNCQCWFHPDCMPPTFCMYMSDGTNPEDVPFDCNYCSVSRKNDEDMFKNDFENEKM